MSEIKFAKQIIKKYGKNENIFEVARIVVGANLLLKMLNDKNVSQEEIQISRKIIKALDELKRIKELEEGVEK